MFQAKLKAALATAMFLCVLTQIPDFSQTLYPALANMTHHS